MCSSFVPYFIYVLTNHIFSYCRRFFIIIILHTQVNQATLFNQATTKHIRDFFYKMVYGEYYNNNNNANVALDWQRYETSRLMQLQQQQQQLLQQTQQFSQGVPPSNYIVPAPSQYGVPTQPVITHTVQSNGPNGQVVVIRKPNEVFVGDLSYFCEEKDLHELFSQYGTVDNCRIVRNDNKNRSLMFGFVCMSSEKEAQAVAKLLHNQTFLGRAMK
jgi:hypothetical protein